MHKFNIIMILFFLVITTALAACSPMGSEKAAAVEAYLQALVEKKADQLAALSCAAWEEDAALELDSFQAVETSLENLACEESGTDGETTLVKCSGKILATYNQEKQELDLSQRVFRVINEGGEERVCGYQ